MLVSRGIRTYDLSLRLAKILISEDCTDLDIARFTLEMQGIPQPF
jgi:hypothetical protein